jgi:hypothetical protein
MKRMERAAESAVGWGSPVREPDPQHAWIANTIGGLERVRGYMLGAMVPALRDQAWSGLNNFVLNPIDRAFISFLPNHPFFRSIARSGVVMTLATALGFTILNQALPLLLVVSTVFTLQATSSLQLEREDFLLRSGLDRQNVASSQLPLVMGVFSLALAMKVGDINTMIMACASLSMALRSNVDINYREELKKAIFESLNEQKHISEQLVSRGARDTKLHRQFKESYNDIEAGKNLIEDGSKALADKQAELTRLCDKYVNKSGQLKSELAALQKQCEALQAELKLDKSFDEIREDFQNQLIERQKQNEESMAATKSSGGFNPIEAIVTFVKGCFDTFMGLPAVFALAFSSNKDREDSFIEAISPSSLQEVREQGADQAPVQLSEARALSDKEHELLHKLSEHLTKDIEYMDARKTQYSLEVMKRSAELESDNKRESFIVGARQRAQQFAELLEGKLDDLVNGLE